MRCFSIPDTDELFKHIFPQIQLLLLKSDKNLFMRQINILIYSYQHVLLLWQHHSYNLKNIYIILQKKKNRGNKNLVSCIIKSNAIIKMNSCESNYFMLFFLILQNISFEISGSSIEAELYWVMWVSMSFHSHWAKCLYWHSDNVDSQLKLPWFNFSAALKISL